MKDFFSNFGEPYFQTFMTPSDYKKSFIFQIMTIDSEQAPGVRDHLNAFLDLPPIHPKHAYSGPLAGLTFGVKETFDIAGYKTTCGNPDFLREASLQAKNAPVVQALLNSGAKFIGKTQCDEFAWCLSGLSTHLDAPINPAAPERTTGGSSSGMAAAVAGGLVDVGLGTDAVGSIRSVANFCGLIGLRITHDRIPLEGIFPGMS
jgi:amidase